MNERIQELAEQSGAGWDHKYHWYVGSVVMERFAELIVQECAGVDLYWLSEQDRKAVAEKIKQHFGVE
jgi:hypothetical protein